LKHARKDYDRIQDPLALIPEDEPVFLLRGQDLAAPDTVEAWAARAELCGANSEIVRSAREQAQAMRLWQVRVAKVPDLPRPDSPNAGAQPAPAAAPETHRGNPGKVDPIVARYADLWAAAMKVIAEWDSTGHTLSSIDLDGLRDALNAPPGEAITFVVGLLALWEAQHRDEVMHSALDMADLTEADLAEWRAARADVRRFTRMLEDLEHLRARRRAQPVPGTPPAPSAAENP
jgi:hypothetical protein